MAKLLQKYNRLNSKEIKLFKKKLNEQFGFQSKLDYIIFKKKEKFYIISKYYDKIQIDTFRINSMGLYIAKEELFGIRLSFEGSQLIGPHSNKNILEIKNKEEWLLGKDIETNEKFKGFVLIKNKEDMLGCGLYQKGIIKNFIPKSRRIH